MCCLSCPPCPAPRLIFLVIFYSCNVQPKEGYDKLAIALIHLLVPALLTYQLASSVALLPCMFLLLVVPRIFTINVFILLHLLHHLTYVPLLLHFIYLPRLPRSLVFILEIVFTPSSCEIDDTDCHRFFFAARSCQLFLVGELASVTTGRFRKDRDEFRVGWLALGFSQHRLQSRKVDVVPRGSLRRFSVAF